METRELYKAKYQAQLHEWKAKLDQLKARGEKLSAQAKLDAKPRIDAVHTRFEAAKARLEDIAHVTDDKWEDVKKAIDHAWSDTRAAIEGAYDAVMAMDEAPTATHDPLVTPPPKRAKSAGAEAHKN